MARREQRLERRRARPSGEAIERGVTGAAWTLGLIATSLVLLFNIDRNWPKVLATASAVALAAGVLGAFAGFLFGLPRDAPAPADAKPGLRFLFNSNLLKVSDWLTTIIVGLTLVSLRSIGPAVAELGDVLDEPLGGFQHSATFGVSLSLLGFTGGAILTYLWTTVRLRQHLERSELELLEAIRDSSAAQVAADFVQGKATEDELKMGLAATTDEGLAAVRARLPDVTSPEAKARRDRAAQIIEDQRSKRGG
jgi:hypothetical protein